MAMVEFSGVCYHSECFVVTPLVKHQHAKISCFHHSFVVDFLCFCALCVVVLFVRRRSFVVVRRRSFVRSSLSLQRRSRHRSSFVAAVLQSALQSASFIVRRCSVVTL